MPAGAAGAAATCAACTSKHYSMAVSITVQLQGVLRAPLCHTFCFPSVQHAFLLPGPPMRGAQPTALTQLLLPALLRLVLLTMVLPIPGSPITSSDAFCFSCTALSSTATRSSCTFCRDGRSCSVAAWVPLLSTSLLLRKPTAASLNCDEVMLCRWSAGCASAASLCRLEGLTSICPDMLLLLLLPRRLLYFAN